LGQIRGFLQVRIRARRKLALGMTLRQISRFFVLTATLLGWGSAVGAARQALSAETSPETQNVLADANGHFNVLLGAATAAGVPAELFGTGQSRWLGVTVARQQEMPRVLLASVPYALRAADADTLGGLPASSLSRNLDPLQRPAAPPFSRDRARNNLHRRSSLLGENRSGSIRCDSVVSRCVEIADPFTLATVGDIWNDDRQTQFAVGASGRTATLGLWPDGLRSLQVAFP
jgi:hypothetical protein